MSHVIEVGVHVVDGGEPHQIGCKIEGTGLKMNSENFNDLARPIIALYSFIALFLFSNPRLRVFRVFRQF